MCVCVRMCVCVYERERERGIPEAKVVMALLLNWLERKAALELCSRNSYVTMKKEIGGY